MKKNNMNKEAFYLKWLLLPEGVDNKELKNNLRTQYGIDTITYETSDSTITIIKPKTKKALVITHGRKIGYYSGRKSIRSIEYFDYGRLNGVATKYYKNRQLLSKYMINYEDTISGIEYDSSGYVKLEYSSDSINIIKTEYFNSYKIKSKTYNRKNKYLNGPLLEFYVNGLLKREQFFIKGRKVGLDKTYFINGNPDSVKNYKDGLAEGDCIYYYKNGKIRARCKYVKSVMNGPFYQYYTNGQTEVTVEFINGDKNGVETRYQPDGTLVSEIKFKDNLQQGPYKLYHKNLNTVFEAGNFIDGFKQGTVNFYSTDGKIVNSIEFNNGKKVIDNTDQ